MQFQAGVWYYNKHSDTFLQCSEMMGNVCISTWSRVTNTDLCRYEYNDDTLRVTDIPSSLTRGFRPFGNLKGRAKVIAENGKLFLQVPRREQFNKAVKEVLPKGFDEKAFRCLAYQYPDLLIDYD